MKSILPSKLFTIVVVFLVSHIAWGTDSFTDCVAKEGLASCCVKKEFQEHNACLKKDSEACNSLTSQYTQQASICSPSLEKRTEMCMGANDLNSSTKDGNMFKSYLNAILVSQNLGNLSPDKVVGSSATAIGEKYNCEYSAKDCKQTIEKVEQDTKSLQDKINETQEKLAEVEPNLDKTIANIEESTQNARENYQNSRDNKNTKLDQLREDAITAQQNAETKTMELNNQIRNANSQLNAKLQEIKIKLNSMNSSMGDLECQKKALEYKKSLGISRNSSISQSINSGSTKTNAISEFLKTCVKTFEDQKRLMMENMNEAIDNNSNYVLNTQSQIDKVNKSAAEKQKTYENEKARTDVQLSEAAQKYDETVTRLKRQYDTARKKAADDKQRLQQILIQLNQQMTQKQSMIQGKGKCLPAGSANSDKTIDELQAACELKRGLQTSLCQQCNRMCASAKSTNPPAKSTTPPAEK